MKGACNKQRLWINKEELAGPAATVESDALSAIIDVNEQ